MSDPRKQNIFVSFDMLYVVVAAPPITYIKYYHTRYAITAEYL